MWSGIPSIFDLGSTKIGAIHPAIKDQDNVQMILTVLDWKNQNLETIAKIPLCSYEKMGDFSGFRTSCLHFDFDSEEVLLVETNAQ